MELTKREVLEKLGYKSDEEVLRELTTELEKGHNKQNTALQSYFKKYTYCFVDRRLIILNLSAIDLIVLALARKILGDYLFGIDFHMNDAANIDDMRNTNNLLRTKGIKASSLKCSVSTACGRASFGGKEFYPEMKLFYKHTFSEEFKRNIHLHDTAYEIMEGWFQAKLAPMTFNEKEFQYVLAACMKH